MTELDPPALHRALPLSPRAYRARAIFTGQGAPILGGVIEVQGSHIVAVGKNTDLPVVDLGDVAIIPGLVNAHVHLEFSDLSAPFSTKTNVTAETSFADWIRQVVAYRRQTGRAEDAIERGLTESAHAGVVALGEIATSDWRPDSHGHSPLGLTVFRESIALGFDRAAAQLEVARQHIAAGQRAAHWKPGVNPHAPYTARRELVAGLAELAASEQVPIAMHLAESPDEVELLATGGGPLRRMLEDFGVWTADAFAPDLAAIDYLRLLSAAPRALVVHGTCLSPVEIEFLSQERARFTVVYCPRTQAAFGYGKHPCAELVRRGVPVAIGTDSRASNPDLSLWQELRHVAAHGMDIDPAEILAMGTARGAAALGWEHKLGTLAAGRDATWHLIPLDDAPLAEPWPGLWSAHRIERTMIRGVWQDR